MNAIYSNGGNFYDSTGNPVSADQAKSQGYYDLLSGAGGTFVQGTDPNGGLDPQSVTVNRIFSDPSYVMTPQDFQTIYQKAYNPSTDGTLEQRTSGMRQANQQSIESNDFMGTYGGLIPIAMFAGPALASAAGIGGGAAASSGLAEEAAALGVGPEVMGTQGLTAGTAFMPLAEEAAQLGVGPEVFGTQGLPEMGGTFGGLAGAEGAGLNLPSLPSAPPGTSTVAQQIAKALTGGASGSGTGGFQGFMQGAQAANPGYVRKSLPFMDQPAFLGDGTQQALGSTEDTAFNKMLSDRGDDISTRAKQMAAQLRGRPGMLAFRST